MRLLISILVLCLSSAALADECVFAEPKGPPLLEVKEGHAIFTWPLSKEWFRCARADKDSRLTVSWLLGGRRGELEPLKSSTPRLETVRETIYRSWYCEQKPLPARVQVKVEGTGAFARLAHESEVMALHCKRCVRRSYQESMALHLGPGALSPRGHVTIEGSYDEEFRSCALSDPEDPASLEMRVYVGKSETEARKRPDHSFVLKGLEKSARYKEPLPLKELCAGGDTWLGVELFGTGELAQMNGSGRSARQMPCP